MGSSKSYSVRLSEDSSIASQENQFLSSRTSRSSTSFGSRLNTTQSRLKISSTVSGRSQSSPEDSPKDNSPSVTNNNNGSMLSTWPQTRSNSSATNSEIRTTRQNGRISRSRSFPFHARLNANHYHSSLSKRFHGEERLTSHRLCQILVANETESKFATTTQDFLFNEQLRLLDTRT